MQKNNATPLWFELPARMDNLERFQDWVLCQVRRKNISPETVSKIELALEEILVNIINYAYPDKQNGTISLQCGYTDESTFSVIIKDTGDAFNPIEQKAPDLSQAVEERPIGGIGLVLVRQMTNKLEYKRTGEANRLHLNFNISGSGQEE